MGVAQVLEDAGIWATIYTIAATIGAVAALYLGWRQLNARLSLAKLAFEDSFTKEYRQIIRSIPTTALLGAVLTNEERRQSLASFYHYVDLCNEQAYLFHTRKRISKRTWREWREGIEGNLARPEFAAAWSYIAHHAATDRGEKEFADLRRVAPPLGYDEGNPYLPAPSDITQTS